MTAFRTATPAINRGKWRHAVALSEFEPLFLNGVQRSVNRKVQGSNPWSGANCKIRFRTYRGPCRPLVQQRCSNGAAAVQLIESGYVVTLNQTVPTQHLRVAKGTDEVLLDIPSWYCPAVGAAGLVPYR